MALKVKFPNQIHLLRGNHEDISINQSFGFAEECEERLEDDLRDKYSVFQTINRLFEWLLLAGIIENRILCLHGGIGSSLQSISELEEIKRPIEVIYKVTNKNHQIVIDVLWSDPTETDQCMGISNNIARDPQETGYIVKYGSDGIERFAKGQLITVFSATDYCGNHKNAGAALFIQKDYEIVPKLIYSFSNSTTWIDANNKSQTPPNWENESNNISFT